MNLTTNRVALSVFFFLSGFSFSTWASRIPTIKTQFGFNDAELGTVLLTMPITSMIGLPISGWLVSRYDSRVPLIFTFLINAVCLSLVSLAGSVFTLVAAVCLFSFTMRIYNICINTQAINLQHKYDRSINGSFHGLWSTGGIIGVGFSTLLVGLEVSMRTHFLMVSALMLAVTLYAYRFLLRNDRSIGGAKLGFRKPDTYILYLGILIFLAAICEGGMFDWSGIYFREVLGEDIFTVGYLTFMVFMALSRFGSDRLIHKIGMPATFLISAAFIVIGISLAVLEPSFWPAIIGFSLVGIGAAAVIPMIYSLAGSSKKYAPGIAISILATYGIVGMLLGPPLIGYLSHAFNLRIAFVLFACCGLMLIPFSRLFFNYKAKQETQSEML